MNKITFDESGYASEDGFIDTHNTDEQGIYTGMQQTQVNKNFGLPSGSYLDEPTVEAGKNQAVVRKDNRWVVVPDFRGQTYYKKATGEAIKISLVGVVSDELTAIERPDEFHEWQGKKWVFNESLKAETIKAQNTQTKNALLAKAKEQIEVLQDAVDLELATPEEVLLLSQWKTYRIYLSRIDVTVNSPVWPEEP